jgi:hypothetical protein
MTRMRLMTERLPPAPNISDAVAYRFGVPRFVHNRALSERMVFMPSLYSKGVPPQGGRPAAEQR